MKINEELNKVPENWTLDIIYDLYRILNKAVDNVYVERFLDSPIELEFQELMNRLLNSIELEKNLANKNYINEILKELSTFESIYLDNTFGNLLEEKVVIQEKAQIISKPSLILNLRNKRKPQIKISNKLIYSQNLSKKHIPLKKGMTTILNHEEKKLIELNTRVSNSTVGINSTKDDILYFSGEINYTTIHYKNGKHVIIAKTITNVEHNLDKDLFTRVHKNFIVKNNLLNELIDGKILIKGLNKDTVKRKLSELKKR